MHDIKRMSAPQSPNYERSNAEEDRDEIVSRRLAKTVAVSVGAIAIWAACLTSDGGWLQLFMSAYGGLLISLGFLSKEGTL